MTTLGALFEGLAPLDSTLSNLSVTGIVSDSRKVRPGDLFAAVAGYRQDGNAFIAEAVSRGAAAVLTDRPVEGLPIPILVTADIRKTLALVACRFYQNDLKDMLIVGVTGTNGKTTITYLMESILSHAGFSSGVIGTVSYRWPGHEETAGQTTPGIIELLSMIQTMRRDGVNAVVMEASSHALDQHRVTGIGFDAAIFTNLTRDHLDYHQNMEAYGAAKARLFSLLKPSGMGVVNADDPAHDLMISSANGRCVTYAIASEADYRAENVRTEDGVTRFSIRRGAESIQISTPLLGRFNILNVTAAVAAGIELGLDRESVLAGIATMSKVRGRMETITSANGFRVVIDYAHTPDALENVLSAAREFTSRRLVVVFGCGGDRDRGKRPQMGRIASKLADQVFVTSDNPRSEKPEAIVLDILNGIEAKRKAVAVVDRKLAIQSALEEARPGDTVVIAGKGHETYQQIGSEKIPFDDAAVAESVLRSLGVWKG